MLYISIMHYADVGISVCTYIVCIYIYTYIQAYHVYTRFAKALSVSTSAEQRCRISACSFSGKCECCCLLCFQLSLGHSESTHSSVHHLPCHSHTAFCDLTQERTTIVFLKNLYNQVYKFGHVQVDFNFFCH